MEFGDTTGYKHNLTSIWSYWGPLLGWPSLMARARTFLGTLSSTWLISSLCGWLTWDTGKILWDPGFEIHLSQPIQWNWRLAEWGKILPVSLGNCMMKTCFCSQDMLRYPCRLVPHSSHHVALRLPRRSVAEEDVVAHRWHMTSADAVVASLPKIGYFVWMQRKTWNMSRPKTLLEIISQSLWLYSHYIPIRFPLHSILGGSVLQESYPSPSTRINRWLVHPFFAGQHPKFPMSQPPKPDGISLLTCTCSAICERDGLTLPTKDLFRIWTNKDIQRKLHKLWSTLLECFGQKSENWYPIGGKTL